MQFELSTTYVILESLQRKGIVSISREHTGSTKFIVEPPSRLVQLAEEQAKKIEAEYDKEKLIALVNNNGRAN